MQFVTDLENLKRRSFVEGDVNDEKLKVMLQRVQDRYIEPILGTPLYKKVLNDIDTDSLVGNYEVLVKDYVLNVVYSAVDIKAATHQNFKIRNKNVGIADDEYTRANTVEENNNLQDELDKDFWFYKNRLIGYLKENYKLFPEYCEVNGDRCDEIAPEKRKGSNYKDNISFI